MKQHYKDITRILGGKYNVAVLGFAFLCLLLLVLFFNPIVRTAKILLVIAVFTLLNVFLKRVMRAFTGVPLEIEVATLASVVTTVVFGVKAGILVAVLTTFAASHFSRGIHLYTPMMASGYVLAAVLALFISPATIVFGGILSARVMNIYLIIIFQFVGYSLLENAMYGASNVVLNAVLFLKLAPWLVKVLG